MLADITLLETDLTAVTGEDAPHHAGVVIDLPPRDEEGPHGSGNTPPRLPITRTGLPLGNHTARTLGPFRSHYGTLCMVLHAQHVPPTRSTGPPL
jgi:hypothetical protein